MATQTIKQSKGKLAFRDFTKTQPNTLKAIPRDLLECNLFIRLYRNKACTPYLKILEW